MTTEKIYEWDVAQVGDESPPFVVEVTRESIADYCTAVRYDNPIYLDEEAAKAAGFPGVIAPPTMIFSYCPMRRVDLTKARGYISPEQSQVAPRSTPYVSGDVRFLGTLVRPGDVITSTVKVHEKYERRGHKFITFIVSGKNQRGEKVGEYLYTCIWEYAQGQKVREDIKAKQAS